MLKIFIKDIKALVCFFLFATLSVFWIFITITISDKEHSFYVYFTNSYWTMAFFGGLFGLLVSQQWGGFKSHMGKSIMFFSLGLWSQVFGQFAYAYYIYIVGVEVPYPSLGDIGFFGTIPLYILGSYYLAKVSGVALTLKSLKGKLLLLLIPLPVLLLSYTVFLSGYEYDWSIPLTTFLDFGYPLGQSIYIAIALLIYFLSKGILGGIMKGHILFLLFALVVQYLSDFVFLYMASRGTWYPGNINDFMYLTSYFLMSVSVLRIGHVALKVKGGNF